MKTKQLSELEIIEETGKYYSKSPEKRRGMDKLYDACVYKTEDGKKCTIGRCGNSKFNFEFEGNINEYINYQQQEDENFKLDSHLFPRYRGKSDRFWSDVQWIHDNDSNWDKKGLTQQGEENVEDIKKKYAII